MFYLFEISRQIFTKSECTFQLYSKRPTITPPQQETDIFAPSNRWATIDGDADRLLYFYCPENSSSVNLLDGDRIASLFTAFIADQLVEHQRLQRRDSERTGASRLTLGVVQTAYANAASTRFLKKYLEGKFSTIHIIGAVLFTSRCLRVDFV